MADKLIVNLNGGSTLTPTLVSNGTVLSPTLAAPQAGTRNYNLLSNRPTINGILLEGDKTFADLGMVSEDSTEGWATKPTYVPKAGEIVIYTDSGKIKIGDGNVCVVDLPFIGESDSGAIMDALRNHINDRVIHVTPEDRDFWDNKLNYDVLDEELVFTRN